MVPIMLWVYPRVCGGTLDAHYRIQGFCGLSPRVRGNHVGTIADGFGSRSIPACAGEPSPGAVSSAAPRVYPRVCGGTAGLITRYSLIQGLSPRVRGNRFTAVLPLIEKGSIPACAGEPLPAEAGHVRTKVYPRVCGGTPQSRSLIHLAQGLSPRVRGNPTAPAEEEARLGSIPACAGEPPPLVVPSMSFRVYPRVCGGTDDASLRVLQTEGLSPRVRGNRCGW